MKIEKLILAALFTITFGMFTFAQDGADECTRYKAIAGNAYQVKDYEKVTEFYVKALNECGTLEFPFYNPFIYSIQQAMAKAETPEAQAAYLDTLLMVYESGQKTHGVQNAWQTSIAYHYLKVGTPGAMKKADAAYKIGIHHEKEKVNKGYLQQYYLNLYNLWVQEQDDKAKAEYKKRIITEYFVLSDYANKGDMGAPIVDFLTTYMDRAATDCESILPEINAFMKDLPQEIEAKKATVKNFLNLLENKGCTKSKEYVMLVDTIIKIDPSSDAIIAKAKMQLSQGQTSAAINTFKDALGMAKDANEKSDIEYEIASAYYRSKNYQSAYSAGLAVSGKNSAKGYGISARSVNALMNDCGVTTFERKANNYYAVELAERAGDSNLVSQMKAACPTSSDIFNADKSVGESVTLSCWGKTYTIKTY